MLGKPQPAIEGFKQTRPVFVTERDTIFITLDIKYSLRSEGRLSFWAIHCTNICKMMIQSKAVSDCAYKRSEIERPTEDYLLTELTKQMERLHFAEFCVRLFYHRTRVVVGERWLSR